MSNGSEHTPERCVHAVDGPDWAGLRELYPDTDYAALIAEGRIYPKQRVAHRLADAVEALEREMREAREFAAAWLAERERAHQAERDALQARLDAMTVEWGIQEREFLDGPWDRIDDGSRWSNRYGKRYTREEAEAEVAKRVNGIDPKLWRRLVSHLVGPWTVVPEGDTNA